MPQHVQVIDAVSAGSRPGDQAAYEPTEAFSDTGTVRRGLMPDAGVWLMHHPKLADMLDPACGKWVDFESVAVEDIRLYGLGSTDRMLVPSMPPHALYADDELDGSAIKVFDCNQGACAVQRGNDSLQVRVDRRLRRC